MPEDPRSDVPSRRLSGIGFELVASVAGFALIGYGWDRYFGTAHWGLLIGALLGCIGGMYNLIRQTMLATRGPASGTRKTNGDGER
jgi:F0F1-type ATP synthase assembly protein I